MKTPPIKELLVNWRRRRKLTQQAAAILLNASISTIQKWEQGVNEPSGMTETFIRNKCITINKKASK